MLPALDGAGLHHVAAVFHKTTVRKITDDAENADLCAVQQGQRREAARSDEPISLTVPVQALRSVLMCLVSSTSEVPAEKGDAVGSAMLMCH